MKIDHRLSDGDLWIELKNDAGTYLLDRFIVTTDIKDLFRLLMSRLDHAKETEASLVGTEWANG